MTDNHRKLEEFLGSYFHQDWMCDAPSSMGVVANYLSEWPEEEANDALQELSALLALQDEAQLRSAVTKMGCYFEPSSEGYVSFTDWMKAVEKEMRRYLDKG